LIINIGIFSVHVLTDALFLHRLFSLEEHRRAAMAIKRELLGVLRDGQIDCSLKVAATEACIKLVTQGGIDHPEDLLAGMIL
jgi:hypothetical protein